MPPPQCVPLQVFPDSGDPQCPGPAPGLCCYKYLVWCSGGRQFYDLSTDPYETRDRCGRPHVLLCCTVCQRKASSTAPHPACACCMPGRDGRSRHLMRHQPHARPLQLPASHPDPPLPVLSRSLDLPPRLLDRFDAIMSTLAHCDGAECRNPYAVLHPGQPVFNLTGVSERWRVSQRFAVCRQSGSWMEPPPHPRVHDSQGLRCAGCGYALALFRPQHFEVEACKLQPLVPKSDPQAADPMYDKLYGSLTKFRFRTCSKLYSVSNEVTWTTSATNGA